VVCFLASNRARFIGQKLDGDGGYTT